MNYREIDVFKYIAEQKEKEVKEEKPKEDKPKEDKPKEDKPKENTPFTGKEFDKEVIYYDKENINKSIFLRAIFITNSLDEEENSSWKLFKEACSDFKPKVECIGLLISDLLINEEDEEHIELTDNETTIDLTNDMLHDTIIIARGGCINRRGDGEDIVSKLSNRGFLLLNDPKGMELASNKLETAKILSEYEIPQPPFCKMNKDIMEDEKTFESAIQKVYPQWKAGNDKFSDLDFVIKILDGSQGKGVFLCKEKQLISYLDSIFSIDSERELIIQKKVEGLDGDLRIHVLNLRDKQIILAAMKRKQVSSKDFRSNKSLGAEVLPIKLNPIQEQIALKTADISDLNWCAVDLMPIKKGSEKEIGDNVVLEINGSPGTEGISDAIDINFWNILLSSYKNPSEFKVSERVVGYFESGMLKAEKEYEVKIKLDTGNGAKFSSIGCKDYKVNGEKVNVKFETFEIELPYISSHKVIVGKDTEERIVVEFPSLSIGNLIISDWQCGLVKNRKQQSNILLCRKDMRGLNFIVNPSKKFLISKEIEKPSI